METGRIESGKKAEKKERDSTAQESDAMLRYIDLKAAAYNPHMSGEDRKNFAQNLIDLVKILTEGEGISSVTREDLLRQIKRIEDGYTSIKRVAEAVKRLERESRGGIQVPHLYSHTVDLIQAAIVSGVPDASLEPFKKTIQDYLYRVQPRAR